MYNGARIMSFIPARGGSKGIKNKNIVDFAGLPLIAYSINASRQSKYIDSTIVSTDSDKIAEVAKQYGAEIPFLRPKELADDHSKTVDAIVNADGTVSPLLAQNSTVRRQDMPDYYRVNGCIYINRIDEVTNETDFNYDVMAS